MSKPYQISHLGVAKDYEYSSTHKRERLTLWWGPFSSVFEGEAYSLPKGDGYMVTLSGGEKVRVACPVEREDDNYMEIDDAIAAAVDLHYATRSNYVSIGE